MTRAQLEAKLDSSAYPDLVGVRMKIDGNVLYSNGARGRRKNLARIVNALAVLWDIPVEWLLSECEPHVGTWEFSIYRDSVEIDFYKSTG